MNVSRLTLSCRWLSSASFSVASSSIASSSAFSPPDTALSRIHTGSSVVSSAARAPRRLGGAVRASMVQDAADCCWLHTASMPCHCWKVATAEPSVGKTIRCSQAAEFNLLKVHCCAMWRGKGRRRAETALPCWRSPGSHTHTHTHTPSARQVGWFQPTESLCWDFFFFFFLMSVQFSAPFFP